MASALPLTQLQFQNLFDAVVAAEFPGSEMGYLEESELITKRLFSGEAERYLGSSPSQHGADVFGFGPVEFAAAIAAGAVPVLQLAKLAAETYLALQKAFAAQREPSPMPPALEAEVALALVGHVGEAQARRIAKQVVGRVARGGDAR